MLALRNVGQATVLASRSSAGGMCVRHRANYPYPCRRENRSWTVQDRTAAVRPRRSLPPAAISKCRQTIVTSLIFAIHIFI
jgi:hypothetical protein